MRLTQAILMCFALSSTAAYAEFTITNHTEFYGSAFIEASPCSASQGDAGVLKPHGKLTIPNMVFTLFCPMDACRVHTFMTKNCSGKEIATFYVNPNKGVIKIDNHDNRFAFTYTKFDVQVMNK